jgi:hypothetical protein
MIADVLVSVLGPLLPLGVGALGIHWCRSRR